MEKIFVIVFKGLPEKVIINGIDCDFTWIDLETVQQCPFCGLDFFSHRFSGTSDIESHINTHIR